MRSRSLQAASCGGDSGCGVEPILGGIEYAEDIIRHLDVDRAARADTSFRHFIDNLRTELQRWQP